MKSRDDNHVCATVFAALTMIGCSLSAMLSRHRQRHGQKQQFEEAVQTWEAEGGAVVADSDEEEAPTPVRG